MLSKQADCLRRFGIAVALFASAGCGIVNYNVADKASKSISAAFVDTQISITEGGAATVAVALSDKQEEDVTLSLQLTSIRDDVAANFLPVSSSIVIPAGDLTTTVGLSSIDDSLMEADKPFVLSISSSDSKVKVANGDITVLIVDDDYPTATLAAAGTDLLENGASTTFTITLDTAPAKAATIDVAFTGTSTIASDFLVTPAIGSSVTFAAGETTKTFTISPIDDTLDDDAETIILTLTSPGAVEIGTPATATINLHEFNLDLNFAGQFNDGTTLSSRGGHFSTLTFSRSTTGTYVDADGIIKTAASGIPRFNHDPITGQPRGILIEMSLVNAIPWSEDFSVGWTTGGFLPFGAGSVIDVPTLRTPSNGLNAELLTEDQLNSAHQLSRSVSIGNSHAFAFSVFARPNGRTKIRLKAYRSTVPTDFITMDCPLDGTAVTTRSSGGSGILTTSEVETYKNGWYKCHLSGKPTTSSAASTFTISLIDGNGNESYLGDGASGVYLWGANINYNSLFVGYPNGSYIPTAGATASRGTDVSSTPTASFLSTSGGSFFGEFSMEGYASLTLYSALTTFDNGSSSSVFTIYPRTTSLTTRIHSNSGGVSTSRDFSASQILTQLFTPHRITMGFSDSNYDAYLNDTYTINSVTGMTGLPTVTRMTVGSSPITSNYSLKGSIARLAYSKYRAPTAQLEDWSNATTYFRKSTPTIRLAQTSLAALESDGPTSFIVGLTEKSSSTVTVNYALTGTATNAVDFTSTSATTGTITFAPGEMRKIVTLLPINDGLVEGSETVIMTLSAPSGATLGTVPVSTMTISD